MYIARGVGRGTHGTHQQTDIGVHRSPRLVMFYGSGYIFFFYLNPFSRSL